MSDHQRTAFDAMAEAQTPQDLALAWIGLWFWWLPRDPGVRRVETPRSGSREWSTKKDYVPSHLLGVQREKQWERPHLIYTQQDPAPAGTTVVDMRKLLDALRDENVALRQRIQDLETQVFPGEFMQ